MTTLSRFWISWPAFSWTWCSRNEQRSSVSCFSSFTYRLCLKLERVWLRIHSTKSSARPVRFLKHGGQCTVNLLHSSSVWIEDTLVEVQNEEYPLGYIGKNEDGESFLISSATPSTTSGASEALLSFQAHRRKVLATKIPHFGNTRNRPGSVDKQKRAQTQGEELRFSVKYLVCHR